MIPILTPEQTKFADKTAIENYGIPALILMENAARSSAKIIQKIIFENEFSVKKISILCGSGNNGGDGFAIARHLFEIFELDIFWVGSRDKMSTETLTNFEIVANLGINLIHISDISNFEFKDYDCIIDALIGIGGSENITGINLEILKILTKIDALKIAIDVPTGLNSLSGIANQFCFEADFTITMFSEKTGLHLNQGPDFSGRILTAYLGAPEFITEEIADIFALQPEDLEILLPKRKRNSSKFDYGKTLIIAGSYKFSGAAALCANACSKSGSGLTYLFSPTIHTSLFPEIITLRNNPKSPNFLDMTDFEYLKNEINKYDSIAVGPGLGDDSETIDLVNNILGLELNVPIIIDADALRAIDITKNYKKNYILTPHIGEFSRLTGLNKEFIAENSHLLVKEWAEKLNCTILLKGIPTIISDGESTYWNLFGNPALAKGGTGDVLSGIITSLTAKYKEMDYSILVAIAALVHSLCADNYIEENSQETMLASDIIENLSNILP